MQCPADVAPTGGGDRDKAPSRPLSGQARGRSCRVAVPHVIGQHRVTQIGPAVQVMHVCLARPEDDIVEHGGQQLAIGLEPVELERRRAIDNRATVESRSTPCAMSLATNES